MVNDRFNEYNDNVCWQYNIRLKNIRNNTKILPTHEFWIIVLVLYKILINIWRTYEKNKSAYAGSIWF